MPGLVFKEDLLPSDDYTKDLQAEVARYALPNPYRHTRQWRLLFISSDGRVVHSGNYRRVVTTFLIFMGLLMVALAVATGLWLHTRSSLAESILREQGLSTTLASQAADQELLMARLALAEKNTPKKVTAPAKPKATAKASKPAPPPKPPFIRVDAMDAQRTEDGSFLNIDFKIANDTPGRKRIKGTLFLVTGTEKNRRCLPPVLLKEGIPSDPSRGEGFQMRNFTNHIFRLRTDAGKLPFKEVILYGFDQGGALRYKKKFTL
ncbi:hypothetical protein [Desulfoluna spongiiphila]|uniref:hypothetical protein n=1 Tax=Desulfoluna spongiiphila TaxID=419481 RepID=UPI000B84A1A6|nr:hypothetical protein [Desulfoluna spongiiphila]